MKLTNRSIGVIWDIGEIWERKARLMTKSLELNWPLGLYLPKRKPPKLGEVEDQTQKLAVLLNWPDSVERKV